MREPIYRPRAAFDLESIIIYVAKCVEILPLRGKPTRASRRP